MDGFLKRKNDVLLKLDKSSKGGWDEKIRDLCEEINSLENYYTTSSCSGRVVLMRDCDEKQAGLFNWVCHDEFGFEELKGELGTICPSNLPRPPNSRLGSESLPPTRLRSAQTKIVRTKTLAPDLCSLRSQIGSVDNGEEILVNCVSAEKSGEADFGADNRATLERGNLDTLRAYPETFSSKMFTKGIKFKMEPCILHIACRTLEDAQRLFDKAKLAGWKRSGIIASENRFMVELNSTEKLEFPIICDRKVLVEDEFLKVVVKEANEKLEKGWKKIEKLKKLLEQLMI